MGAGSVLHPGTNRRCCGTACRYLLVYPHGCDVANHLSLFLCGADYDKLLPGWSHFAQVPGAVPAPPLLAAARMRRRRGGLPSACGD